MADLIFSIYKYNVSQASYKQDLPDGFYTPGNVHPKDYPTLHDYFREACLRKRGAMMEIHRISTRTGKDAATNRSGVAVTEKDTHSAKVIENKDGIVILHVQANKSKTIHNADFTDEPVGDYPPFFVIFDNRPGHQYLAIENKGMKADDSVLMLHNEFNNTMEQCGIAFEVSGLFMKYDNFHSALVFFKKYLKSAITKLSFEFGKRSSDEELPPHLDHFIKEWMEKFSEGGKIEAAISNDENLMLATDIKQDIELLANLCLKNSKYKLSAWFGNKGIYRYGKENKAQFGMDSKILDLFVNPPVMNNSIFHEPVETSVPSLNDWLDNVKEIFQNYDKARILPRSRTKVSRKRL